MPDPSVRLFIRNMAGKSKYLQQKTTTILNKETGEHTEVSKMFKVSTNTEEFYISYVENMAGVFNLKSAVDIKVLIQMCRIAEYNTGRVYLTPKERNEMMQLVGVSTQQVTNSLSNLKRLQLIEGDRGNYDINPAIFWKGDSKSREKLIKSGKVKVTLEFR